MMFFVLMVLAATTGVSIVQLTHEIHAARSTAAPFVIHAIEPQSDFLASQIDRTSDAQFRTQDYQIANTSKDDLVFTLGNRSCGCTDLYIRGEKVVDGKTWLLRPNETCVFGAKTGLPLDGHSHVRHFSVLAADASQLNARTEERLSFSSAVHRDLTAVPQRLDIGVGTDVGSPPHLLITLVFVGSDTHHSCSIMANASGPVSTRLKCKVAPMKDARLVSGQLFRQKYTVEVGLAPFAGESSDLEGFIDIVAHYHAHRTS